MAERAKKLLKQLTDLWNKYTGKQKTLIISAACVVIFALALMAFLMQRTEYKQLRVCESADEASDIVKMLKDQSIAYKFNETTLTITVDASKYQDAYFALIENDIPTTGITVDDLLTNSLSTTNADRNLKLNLYFQNQLHNSLIQMEGIEDAQVYYIPSESSDSILTEAQDTSASVLLTINEDDFKTSTAQTIAEIVASVLGNSDTKLIKVADQFGNLLFGGENDLYDGNVSSMEDYKERLTNNFINRLNAGLIKSGYTDAEIIPNLDFDMDAVTELYKEYSVPEGLEQGYLGHSYTYNAENAGTSGGTPGTDSNSSTTYTTTDTSSSNGTVDIVENDYLPNSKETNTQYEVGAIIPENSSIGIVLTHITTYKESDLEAQGLLQGTTFDQYVAAHSARTAATVDQTIYNLVSMSTGISTDKITINAYEQPVYVPTVTTTKSWTDYIQIVLAVLIVALLVFVVFKGVKPVEVTELEPELSVEQLLATTKENQTIEDIEFNEVSEVRRMIEKFVDEKPEAVAQLLRNWLNEDWN